MYKRYYEQPEKLEATGIITIMYRADEKKQYMKEDDIY